MQRRSKPTGLCGLSTLSQSQSLKQIIVEVYSVLDTPKRVTGHHYAQLQKTKTSTGKSYLVLLMTTLQRNLALVYPVVLFFWILNNFWSLSFLSEADKEWFKWELFPSLCHYSKFWRGSRYRLVSKTSWRLLWTFCMFLALSH